MTYTKEQLLEKYRNLPDDIKQVYDSDQMIDAIIDIGNKYKLHIDQRGELANEIGMVFLGVTRPSEFLANIEQRLKISIEEAGEIVKDINSRIFFPIRASLEKLNGASHDTYRPERAPLVENFSPAGNVSGKNIIKTAPNQSAPANNAIIIGSTKPLLEGDDADRRLFEEKMSKLFRLPKEEVELGRTHPSSANANDQASKVKTDPYREPTN